MSAPFNIGTIPKAASNIVKTIDRILIHQNLTFTKSACNSPMRMNFPLFESSEIFLFPP